MAILVDSNSDKIYKEIERLKLEYESWIREGERDVPQLQKNNQLFKIEDLNQELHIAVEDEWKKLFEEFVKDGINKLELDLLRKKAKEFENYRKEDSNWIRKYHHIIIKKAHNEMNGVKTQSKIDEKISTLKSLFDLVSAYERINSKSYLLRPINIDGYLVIVKSLEEENERRKTSEQTLTEYKENLDIDSYNEDFVCKIESNYFKFKETIFEGILELFQPSLYYGWQNWKKDNYKNNKEQIDQIKIIVEEARNLNATSEWMDLFLKILMIDKIFSTVRI